MVPVNDAPADGDESNFVFEDTTLTVADGAAGDLLNNATDVDGNPLTITQFTVPGVAGTITAGSPAVIAGVGTLTINANGSYSFVPVANFAGAIPVVTYTVADGQGGTDTSTLTLTMVPVNDAPVDGNESNTVTEDTTLTVPAATGLLANASDVDGNPLTVSAFTVNGVPGAIGSALPIAGVGSITISADGSYSFTPLANFNGPIPVVNYTVSDGLGVTDTSTLTLTMAPANDAPVDGDESNTVTEDTTLTVPAATGLLANATDVEGNPLTVSAFTVGGTAGVIGTPLAIPGVGSITVSADGAYS